jgi:hypothetical protein
MKTPRKQNNLHKILHNLVTVKVVNDKYFWGRETKIVKQLVEKYGEDFMLYLKPPAGYRIQSMVFFKTQEGQKHLTDQLFEYRVQQGVQPTEKPVIVLSPEKIGEDVEVKRKPRTLKEFLNQYAQS